MVKRIGMLAMALCLVCTGCLADMKLAETTPAQKMLKTYIANVNSFLVELGELEVNTVFDQAKDVTELGIAETDNVESAENASVTITVYLYYDSINSLLLRVNDTARFPALAAAFLQGLNPKTMTREQALKVPTERAKTALDNPLNSFEEKVEELNGTAPRTYYAYFPNQYHDGVHWIQMTIIFPLEGYWNEETGVITGDTATKAPSTDSDQDEGYEGYYSSDDYEHLEVFATPTPEPDSAAAEYDEWNKER